MEPVKKANKTIFGKFGKKAFYGLLIFALTIVSIEILSVYADTCSEFKISFATNNWLSSGKYEQDVKDRFIGQTNLEGSFLSSTPYGSFYSTDRQLLANGPLNYTHGMLKNYTIECEINKSVVDFLIEVMNRNEVCYLCYDISQEEVKHPGHEMKESIIVNGTKVKYYEDWLECYSKAESLKMKLDCGALQYTIDLGGIPASSITDAGTLIDSAYRGKMLFMSSNDYYINDLDKTYITLAKGEKLQISSAGFTEPKLPQLRGYRKFKLLKVIQANGRDVGVVIEIEKPDGTTTQVTASKQRGALLRKDTAEHQVLIQVFQIIGNTASIIAYDVSTLYKLENNKKQEGWMVKIEKGKCNEVGIEDYGTHDKPIGNANRKYCLTKLTLTQEDAQTLSTHTYYIDADNDNYGNAEDSYTSCDSTSRSGFVTNKADCNDNDRGINPATTETCNNIDDNCNRQIDEELSQACTASNTCSGTQTCTNGQWGTCITNLNHCDTNCDGVLDICQESPCRPCKKSYCGDGVCDETETQQTCPKDCGSIVNVVCGNDICDKTESYENCPSDCKKPDEFPWLTIARVGILCSFLASIIAIYSFLANTMKRRKKLKKKLKRL